MPVYQLILTPLGTGHAEQSIHALRQNLDVEEPTIQIILFLNTEHLVQIIITDVLVLVQMVELIIRHVQLLRSAVGLVGQIYQEDFRTVLMVLVVFHVVVEEHRVVVVRIHLLLVGELFVLGQLEYLHILKIKLAILKDACPI